MERKYKLGLYSLIAFGVIALMVLSINITSDTGADIVNEEISSNMGIMDYSEPPATSTNVQWHGKLDLFVKEAGSNKWEQVVQGEPNLITNIGADRLRGYLNGTITSGETIANMSLSNDGTAASAAWTILPSEIANNGLDRATSATGLVNNGTGAFNITHTWTASASQSCQLIGTHWNATDSLDGNLFSALQFSSQSLLVNDQLKAVYSVTIS